jgi:hypothetical protein
LPGVTKHFKCLFFHHDDTQRILHVGSNAADIPRLFGELTEQGNTGRK